jgi:hypothetical protein
MSKDCTIYRFFAIAPRQRKENRKMHHFADRESRRVFG